MDKKYYIFDAEKTSSIMSGELQIIFSKFVSSDQIIKRTNELILEDKLPIIIELKNVSLYDNNSIIDPSDFRIKNPSDVGIFNTTANKVYDTINKYSKTFILNNIIKENKEEAKNIIKLYNKLIIKAEKLNIKNAKEAALMTAIKKSGAKYAI